MPYTIDAIDDGYILVITITVPITLDDLRELYKKIDDLFDKSSHVVHLSVNPSEIRFEYVPKGTRAEPVPFLKNPNCGYIAIVGDVPMAKGIVTAITAFIGFKKVKFYNNERQALAFLRKEIARERGLPMPVSYGVEQAEGLATGVGKSSASSDNPHEAEYPDTVDDFSGFDHEPDNEYARISDIRPSAEALNRAFDGIIAELRGNKRVKQPTKLEQVIEIIRANPEYFTSIDAFVPLCEGTYNPRQAASNLLVTLNLKLGKYGLQLYSTTAYAVQFLNSEF